ncbi:MAG: hypothetical protein ACLRRT_10935 [Ruthenibacterium lactatiformans]
MESVITGLVSRFGYWGVLLLIAVENIFRRSPGGDPHLRRLFNDLYGDDAPGVILFSTLGSVAGPSCCTAWGGFWPRSGWRRCFRAGLGAC